MSKTNSEHLARIWLLRKFVESDEFYTPAEADNLLTRYAEPFIGLDLPKATCEKIYSSNFRRLWGEKPRRLNVDSAITALEKQGNSVVAKALKNLH